MADKINVQTKLRQSKDYTQDTLVRDLLDIIAELNKILAEYEARLTAGGL